jgi:hypothetical protein
VEGETGPERDRTTAQAPDHRKGAPADGAGAAPPDAAAAAAPAPDIATAAAGAPDAAKAGRARAAATPAGRARAADTMAGRAPGVASTADAAPDIAGPTVDPRLPIWGIRALFCLVAFLAVTIWHGWRLGLTAAAVIAIADTIYRSKTMAVIPAAARAGSAQRRTRRRLFLAGQFGYHSLHARAIPGTGEMIDHLVIGPGGVFALDSERWDRRLPVRTVGGKLLYHGPFDQQTRLAHARWEAARASSLLSAELGTSLLVRPVMTIYGPTVPWVVASLNEVDVFAGRRLGRYFRRQNWASRRGRQPRLDPRQIEAVYQAAAQVLPPASRR